MHILNKKKYFLYLEQFFSNPEILIKKAFISIAYKSRSSMMKNRWSLAVMTHEFLHRALKHIACEANTVSISKSSAVIKFPSDITCLLTSVVGIRYLIFKTTSLWNPNCRIRKLYVLRTQLVVTLRVLKECWMRGLQRY